MEILIAILRVVVPGLLIPLAVTLLTAWWPNAPTWLKAIAAPVLVPALMFGASWLSGFLGVPIDISGIIEIITVATAGVSASVAYTLGKRKEHRKLKGHS